MTQVHIEYGVLARRDHAHPNMLEAVPTTAVGVTSSGTATSGGSRPTVPSGVDVAIISAIDGNVIVAPPGANPTADQTSGKLCLQGVETAIFVTPGDLLSFIDLA